MDRILALSGWGQPHDALKAILPGATHFDYAGYDKVHDALKAIATTAKDHDAMVGWSLGGQLAARAVAAGMARPKKLVLIAAPFQFVETPALKLGLKRDEYEKFRDNYARNARRTLDKAWELVIKDDKHEPNVRVHLDQNDKAQTLDKDWLKWLYLLDDFSFAGLPLQDFPPTLILHGKNDVVVGHEQAGHFARHIPQAKTVYFDACGHAPHWHNAAEVTRLIREHIGV